MRFERPVESFKMRLRPQAPLKELIQRSPRRSHIAIDLERGIEEGVERVRGKENGK